MGKISTYTQVATPSLSDILIGTDVGSDNATKNFSIGDIIGLIDTPSLYTILVLDTSYAIPQNPPTVDTPLTVKFSTGTVGSINDPVMYNVGSPDVITFNEEGSYIINAFGNVYRSTNGGVAHLKFRALVNGVEAGYVKSINIDQNTFKIPYEITIPIYVNAGTTLKFEIMRDSSGVDDGGLNRDTVSLAGWGNIPSAYIQIWQQKIA